MLKLYKTIDKKLYYWETWNAENKAAIIHWGKVGETGETQEIKSRLFSSYERKVRKAVDKKVSEGYTEYDNEKISILAIEFVIDGFGTVADLDKRHRLEDRMDHVLGWTGLGHCDGGSIGSGTMEVGCVVVDFDIAKGVIENNLAGTEFSDFSRIFKMGQD